MKNSTKRKEPTSVEKRSLRMQQVMFGTLAAIVILSMLLSLTMK